MKIIKATDADKKHYRGLHPLFGSIIVPGVFGKTKGRWCCSVEYLGEGKGEPNYEVLAPTGMHFEQGTHTILGTTQRDLLDQIDSLVACNKDC